MSDGVKDRTSRRREVSTHGADPVADPVGTAMEAGEDANYADRDALPEPHRLPPAHSQLIAGRRVRRVPQPSGSPRRQQLRRLGPFGIGNQPPLPSTIQGRKQGINQGGDLFVRHWTSGHSSTALSAQAAIRGTFLASIGFPPANEPGGHPLHPVHNARQRVAVRLCRRFPGCSRCWRSPGTAGAARPRQIVHRSRHRPCGWLQRAESV